MTGTVGRLLRHDDDLIAAGAAFNMSVDQAIAESVSQAALNNDRPVPTLRLYRWSQPTLSLGYFQASADCLPRFAELSKVRRATGGGAILHHRELTYSLIVPTPPGQRGARHDLYQAVHQSIIAAFAQFSVSAAPYRSDPRPMGQADAFLCFQRRTDEDLLVSGYKVVGSAQRREKRSILQHGSILLAASEYAPELPGVFELTSQRLSPSELGALVAQEIGMQLNISFVLGDLTKGEHVRTNGVVSERFGDTNWWSRR